MHRKDFTRLRQLHPPSQLDSQQFMVNTPPAEAGGFRLRLEAGLIDPSGRLVKLP
jgi:hypothetical protein